MADELEFLTKSADETTWVDLLPESEVTGYQNQNTNIESRNLGQDDTSISIAGTNITLDPSGVIDDDGLPIVIKSAVTLPVGSDGDWYIKVVAGSSSTLRSLTLQNGGGTWDTSKQGYYDTTDRVLNWKITRASGVLKLFKRTKPNEGLELNGNIKASQADIPTVNTTDVNAITVESTTGNITTVNSTTVNTDSINTGNGSVECYAMDQPTRTTDSVTFDTVNTGQGNNELYKMDQDVRTTDPVVFDSVDTGYGANEVLPEDVYNNTVSTSVDYVLPSLSLRQTGHIVVKSTSGTGRNVSLPATGTYQYTVSKDSGGTIDFESSASAAGGSNVETGMTTGDSILVKYKRLT